MYRNRARAAHKLQSQVPVQQQPGVDNQQQYGGYNQQQQGWDGQAQQPVQQEQQPQQSAPAAVPFFNPAQYQNGVETQQAMDPGKMNGTDGPNQNQYNGSGGGAEWQNYNQNNVVPDQNHNHNLQYNLNQVSESQPEYNSNHVDHLHPEKQQTEVAAVEQLQATPDVTLDPSGQWYWDYAQQQWCPYYPPQPSAAQESLEDITQGIQQLTTAARDENLTSREPSMETQDSQQKQYSQDQQQLYGQEQHQYGHDQQQQLYGHDQQQILEQEELSRGYGLQQQLTEQDQQLVGHDGHQHGQQHQLMLQGHEQIQLQGDDQQQSQPQGHDQLQLPGQDQQQLPGHDEHQQNNHQLPKIEQQYRGQEQYQPYPVEQQPQHETKNIVDDYHLLNGQAYPPRHEQHDGRRSSQVSDIASHTSLLSDMRQRQDSQMSDTQTSDIRRQDSLVSEHSQMSDHGTRQMSDLMMPSPSMTPVVQTTEAKVTLGQEPRVSSQPWIAPPPMMSLAPPLLAAAPPMGFSHALTGAPPMPAVSTSDPLVMVADPVAQASLMEAPQVAPDSIPLTASPLLEMSLAAAPSQSGFAPPPMAGVSPTRAEVVPNVVSTGPQHYLSDPVPAPVSVHPHNLGPPDLVDHRPNTSQPELVSDISHTSGPVSPHHQQPRSVPPPDMFASLPSGPEHIPAPPDLTSQSVIHAPHSVSSAGSHVSHDQHYEFYSQAYSSSHGMPDVTGQQGAASVGQGAVQQPLAHVKAPDILRTESVTPAMSSVPSSDRNLFMETGELMEEDAVRVSHEPPPLHSPHSGQPAFPQLMGAASLPPMVGGNEHYEQQGPPLMRLVVGESHSAPPPLAPQRLVEGETNHQQMMPVSREVEGESHPAPSPGQHVYSPQPQLNREPLEGESEPPHARLVPGLHSPSLSGAPPLHPPSILSVQVPPIDHPAPHQSPAEARSEAAGSDRRDVDVMGGPPHQVRPAPLPTPGRDIAGEESQSGGTGGQYRRGDARDPYDSEDDRDRDSDSEERRRQYGNNRNRRTVSPGARSGHNKPARVMDRSYRSSTDREEGERRYGGKRREDDRKPKRGDKDHRSYYDLREERRQRERDEEDERRSIRDYRTRPVKREPYDDYEDERSSHRPSRPASRTGSVSHYGEHESSFGYRNMSREWAMMQQQQAMMQQQYLHQQQMMAVNPLQFQLQTAVAEMEKALDTASNVMIYKQHWDYYSKAPALLEKLKVDQPIMHHLLQHFRQNFWHLVEQQMGGQDTRGREGAVSATPSNATLDTDGPSSALTRQTDSFTSQFHGAAGGEDSSIREELEQYSNYNVDQSSIYNTGAVVPARLTPLMFSRPHTCARISAGGLLVKVDPNNPQEGQTATVELHSLAAILRDTKESEELEMFPGPLKPGVTHKNDVIKFCERKIAACRGRRDMADKESYILLWDMLVLLLRQKGQVEGSDLAELLLRDNREIAGQVEMPNRSRASSHREMEGGATSSASSVLNEEMENLYTVMDRGIVNTVPTTDPVDKFRSYLLHGNKVEGLEFAMKAGLWGHALFLASKMDQRTYAGVMTRFANGLAINDPLQTLYQLMSARMPSAMKQCADQRWGDWRPHLAMILSNHLPGSDINTKSMITLGDSLLVKGQLFAAQFCYIVADAEWGTYSNKCAKLVLLLSSVADKSLDQFATTEAIQCTEIYEFVQKLGNKEFQMPSLQPYKYLHCLRLVETGHSTRGQDYARVLADYVTNTVAAGHTVEQETVPGWVGHTAYLAEKLKYLDPVYTTSVGEMTDIADPEWLVSFRATVASLQWGYADYTQGGGEQESYPGQSEDQTSYNQEEEQIVQPEQVNGEVVGVEQQASLYEQQPGGYDQQQHNLYDQGGYDQQQSNGYEQQPNGYDHQQPGVYDQQQYPGGYDQLQQPGGYDQLQHPVGYDQQQTENSSQSPDQQPSTQSEVPPAFFNPVELNPSNPSSSSPTFFNPASLPSIPEQSTRKSSLSRQGSLSSPAADLSRQNSIPRSRQTSESAEPPPSSYYAAAVQKPSPPPQKSPEKEVASKKPAKPAAAPKKSWFGGIFSKIIKSDQVHLPDDKDKTIVYDEAKGRWVNLDGEEDDLAPAAPPPMDPAFSSPSSGPAPGPGGPPVAPTSYRAGLGGRRGRGYVDVLGQAGLSKPMSTPMIPNGAPPGGMLGSPPAMGGMAPPVMLNPNLAPTSSDGPTSLTTSNNPYMVPGGGGGGDENSANSGPSSMPMMFNPSSMAGVSADQPPGF